MSCDRALVVRWVRLGRAPVELLTATCGLRALLRFAASFADQQRVRVETELGPRDSRHADPGGSKLEATRPARCEVAGGYPASAAWCTQPLRSLRWALSFCSVRSRTLPKQNHARGFPGSPLPGFLPPPASSPPRPTAEHMGWKSVIMAIAGSLHMETFDKTKAPKKGKRGAEAKSKSPPRSRASSAKPPEPPPAPAPPAPKAKPPTALIALGDFSQTRSRGVIEVSAGDLLRLEIQVGWPGDGDVGRGG